MDTVKSVILVACVMGIITTIFEISSPEGKLKNQLQILIGIITVLVVVTPFTENGFKISLDSFDFTENQNYYTEKIENKLDNGILNSAIEKTEEYFRDKLNNNDIKVNDLKVNAYINSDDEIEINELYIAVDEKHTDTATSIIKEDLPKVKIIINEGTKIEM